jgi:hypothetical protein
MHPHSSSTDPDSGEARPQVVVVIGLAGLLTLLILGLLFYRSRHNAESAATGEGEAVAAETAAAETAPVAESAPRAPKIIKQDTLRDKWGIVISSVRLTAGGTTLDVRYKVIDDQKASGMHKLQGETYLQDQNSGRNMSSKAQVQPLVTQEMSEGKTYFMMFPNRGRSVRSGDTVTLVIAGTRAENLVVD